MCGICGFTGPRDARLLRAMTWDLRRRGPDAAGYFEDEGASLGHRRLSIIDLATGDQPMSDGPGRPVIVYNGELYNYRELGAELAAAGTELRTKSDTEVILRAFERWGLSALRRFEGIFAFAIWEPGPRRLTLARDHLGVKPLRYRVTGERIFFASETRALFRTPGFRRQPRAAAIDALLTFRYEPEGDVFEDARLLPPGHALVFENGRARLHSYWEPTFARRASALEGDARSFERLFDAAVGRQLVADVPIGIFLSGGLDSSAVLDAAHRAGARDLLAFSIGFGTEKDELDKAALVAKRYGARHERVVLSKEEFAQRLGEVFATQEEPVLDAIQVATYVLAEAASRRVKVVLTGDGADEILAGYVHHRSLAWLALLGRLVPRGTAGPLAALVRALPLELLERAFPYPARLGESGRRKVARLVERLGALGPTYLEAASLLDDTSRGEAYTSAFREEVGMTSRLVERTTERVERLRASGPRRAVDRIVDLDLATWLPNNILMKLDRLTMAHGLEGRVPFLDRGLVEHALGSPHKGPPFETKALLREALAKRLPPEIVRQPKQSFYFPLEESLGPAYDALVRDILDPATIRRRGLLEPAWIDALLARGRSRELVESKRLFAAFALELWLREVVDRPLPTSAS